MTGLGASTYKIIRLAWASLIGAVLLASPCQGAAAEQVDYLDFSRGVVPVALGGMAADLKVTMEAALGLIDGNPGGFVMTQKPGDPETAITVT